MLRLQSVKLSKTSKILFNKLITLTSHVIAAKTITTIHVSEPHVMLSFDINNTIFFNKKVYLIQLVSKYFQDVKRTCFTNDLFFKIYSDLFQ
jgi:hypothetical protein